MNPITRGTKAALAASTGTNCVWRYSFMRTKNSWELTEKPNLVTMIL
jgi:hypothetical protein